MYGMNGKASIPPPAVSSSHLHGIFSPQVEVGEHLVTGLHEKVQGSLTPQRVVVWASRSKGRNIGFYNGSIPPRAGTGWLRARVDPGLETGLRWPVRG
ncbi:hypothetical protein J6590_020808 [Homalodisca vitripennis]|nr:hypothetical protein J6590_020808 [Homalodisca vitripennis]